MLAKSMILIPPELLIPEISIDAEINFTDISPKLVRILKEFEPFGPQNMHPVFASINCFDTGYAKTLGGEDEHIKLFVKQNESDGIGAIGFGLGKHFSSIQNREPFQMAYVLDENEWNGKVDLQLNARAIKI